MLFHCLWSNKKKSLKKILLYTCTLSHFLCNMALLRVVDLCGKYVISLTAKKICVLHNNKKNPSWQTST